MSEIVVFYNFPQSKGGENERRDKNSLSPIDLINDNIIAICLDSLVAERTYGCLPPEVRNNILWSFFVQMSLLLSLFFYPL